MVDVWQMIWGAWTNLFEKLLGPGGGNVFFLIPVLVLTMGLWVKNPDKPMVAVAFLIIMCALLGSGNIFLHASGAAAVCIILSALGLTSMVLNIVFQQRRQ